MMVVVVVMAAVTEQGGHPELHTIKRSCIGDIKQTPNRSENPTHPRPSNRTRSAPSQSSGAV